MSSLKSNNPLYIDTFFHSLVSQIRANDMHSIWGKKPDEELITELFIRPRTNQESSMDNEKPTPVKSNPYARSIFQAVSAAIEKETGIICNLIVEIGCDGSMKAIVYNEDNIILNKTLWNSNNLYYETLKGLKKAGSKMIETAINKISIMKNAEDKEAIHG